MRNKKKKHEFRIRIVTLFLNKILPTMCIFMSYQSIMVILFTLLISYITVYCSLLRYVPTSLFDCSSSYYIRSRIRYNLWKSLLLLYSLSILFKVFGEGELKIENKKTAQRRGLLSRNTSPSSIHLCTMGHWVYIAQ